MEDIKVSIIVPSYKRHKELFSRAIQSLLGQTYENIEIVVIDDNAKPGLKEYREELSNYIKELNLSKIIYVQNEQNLGSAKTRNVGIKTASGKYITFLDDDDTYLKDKIKNQINFMLANNLDMSFTNQIIKDEQNNIIDFREYRRLKSNDNLTIFKYHLTKKVTGTNTFMVSKALLDKIGGFNGVDMGDEYYLMYDIIKTNCKIGYFDDTCVVAFRAGQSSLTVGTNRLIHEKAIFALIKSNFDKLSFRERCYARFRYNVTKLMTYKRAKKYSKCLGSMVLAFFSSPISFIIEPIRMKHNIRRVVKAS